MVALVEQNAIELADEELSSLRACSCTQPVGLYRGFSSTRTLATLRKCIETTFFKRIIHSSILTVPLSDSPTNGSERHFEACATTHIPQVQLDRVLFYECDHRADELIGLKVDVSGEFITEFELVFVQEP